LLINNVADKIVTQTAMPMRIMLFPFIVLVIFNF
jgi:hypothetical protein